MKFYLLVTLFTIVNASQDNFDKTQFTLIKTLDLSNHRLVKKFKMCDR